MGVEPLEKHCYCNRNPVASKRQICPDHFRCWRNTLFRQTSVQGRQNLHKTSISPVIDFHVTVIFCRGRAHHDKGSPCFTVCNREIIGIIASDCRVGCHSDVVFIRSRSIIKGVAPIHYFILGEAVCVFVVGRDGADQSSLSIIFNFRLLSTY